MRTTRDVSGMRRHCCASGGQRSQAIVGLLDWAAMPRFDWSPWSSLLASLALVHLALASSSLHYSDFTMIHATAQALHEGRPAYEPILVNDGLWRNMNPPQLNLLTWPLAAMALPLAAQVFRAANVAAMAAAVLLVLSPRELATRRGGWVMVAALTSPALVMQIGAGQVAGLLSLAAAIAWRASVRGRWLASGAALGLLRALKPSFAPVALWLLMARRWRAAAMAAVAGSLVVLVVDRAVGTAAADRLAARDGHGHVVRLTVQHGMDRAGPAGDRRHGPDGQPGGRCGQPSAGRDAGDGLRPRPSRSGPASPVRRLHPCHAARMALLPLRTRTAAHALGVRRRALARAGLAVVDSAAAGGLFRRIAAGSADAWIGIRVGSARPCLLPGRRLSAIEAVQHAGAGQLVAMDHSGSCLEQRLEAFPGVVVVDVRPQREEALDHRVVAAHPFDDA